MKVKSRDMAATALVAKADSSIDLDKPIFTLSVASEILDMHPRTLMMYERLSMIQPKRTLTNRRRYSRRDVMKLQAIQTLTRDYHVNSLAGVRYILALLKRLQRAGVEPPEDLKNLDVTQLDV
jgi:MerR family transcriptional regulator/heat shock protein HspR